MIAALVLLVAPEFTSVTTESSVDNAAAPSSCFQWLSTSSSSPE